MTIKIYGPGCARCKQAEKVVRDTVASLGIEADIQKVEDIQAMVKAGVLATPAIEFDGIVKITGRVPKPEEIRKALAG